MVRMWWAADACPFKRWRHRHYSEMQHHGMRCDREMLHVRNVY
jgi:hypothetical protein